MLEFPVEIWLHIIDYIPSRYMLQLYSVNRTFFDIVMDKKYQHIALDHLSNQTIHRLDSLLNLDIARRVKSLRIAPRIFAEKQPCLPQHEALVKDTRGGTLVGPLTADSQPVSRSGSNVSNIVRRLPQIGPNLKNITIFCIRWEESSQAFPAVYRNCLWTPISQTLQYLNIITTVTNMTTLLLPLPVTNFPCLKYLRLSVDLRGTNEESSSLSELQLAMASFVNLSRDTLEHLSIHCSPPPYDLPLLYKNLLQFSRLSTVDIGLSQPSMLPDKPYPTQSLLFISRHSSTIRNIFITSAKFQPQGWRKDTEKRHLFRLELGQVQYFLFSAEVWTGSTTRTHNFVIAHRSILQHLEITGSLSPGEVDDLLKLIDHNSTDSRVKQLSISIYRLDVAFLLKIMRSLPALKRLKLGIMKISSATIPAFTPGKFFPLLLPPRQGVHEFVSEVIQCQELATWKLAKFLILRHSSCCDIIILPNLVHLFSTCISSISDSGDIIDPTIPYSSSRIFENESRSECTCDTEGLDGVDGD